MQTCALNEINSKRGKLFFNLRASETDNHFASSHCAALMSWTLLLFLFFDQSIFVELVIYILCASVDEDEQQWQLQQHRLYNWLRLFAAQRFINRLHTHTHTWAHSAGNQLVAGVDLTIQPASQSSLLLLLWQDAVINYVWERRCECVCVCSFFAFLERIRAAVGASSKQPKKVLTFLSLLSGTFYFYFYYHFFLLIGRLVNVCSLPTNWPRFAQVSTSVWAVFCF